MFEIEEAEETQWDATLREVFAVLPWIGQLEDAQ